MNRIYETDSYIREFKTTVTAAGTDEKGRPYVELEDTIFFPEEGGQKADTGVLELLKDGVSGDVSENTIKTVDVLDGIIYGRNTCSKASETGEIKIRYIVSETVEAGTSVLCKLNWGERFDRMQNHSGEHILSGLMHRRFGVDNVGFHLSDTGPVTLDFNRVVSYEDVIALQNEANRVIYDNIPVSVLFPTGDELEGLDYRSKIDIEGQVRLVRIGDADAPVDLCACCAPHVSHTGEIGILKVLSVVNWKGGIRVSMLCGRRALEYINEEHDILQELAKKMSTEAVNIPGIVDSYRDEIVSLKAGLAGAKEKALISEMDRLTGPYVVFGDGDLTAVSMKNVYNELTDRFDGFVGVFAGDDEQGYRYNAGSRDRDSRELAAKLKEAFDARGGGSAEMIQGKVKASKEAITGLFGELEN